MIPFLRALTRDGASSPGELATLIGLALAAVVVAAAGWIVTP